MTSIEELMKAIAEAYEVINELGNHEWNADQVDYQKRRIAQMQREIDKLKG